jgi:hypothetical protein
MSVEPWQGVELSTPVLHAGHAMIDCNGVGISARQSTSAAASSWGFEAPCPAWTAGRMPSSSCPPLPPISVRRTPRPVHLHLRSKRGLRVAPEGVSWRGRLDTPSLALVHPPVLPPAPAFGRVRMAVHGPGASRPRPRVVPGAQDLCPRDVTVSVAPPAHAGGERVHPPVLRRVCLAGHGLMSRGALAQDSGATRGDAGFEPVPTSSALATRRGFPHGVVAAVHAEQVEARGVVGGLPRVREPRVAGLQSATHGAEPCRDQWLAPCHDGAISGQDPQVLGVHDHVGRLHVAAAAAWACRGAGRCQAVEGDVGQPGRPRTALPGPGCGRQEGALIEDPGVAPGP